MPINDAQAFVRLVRTIVEQELNNRSSDAVAEVESVNDDGTLNLYILPDKQNVVHSIKNESKYSFKKGDSCLVYLINNKLSNSFVITKYGSSKVVDESASTSSASSSGGIVNIYTTTGSAQQNLSSLYIGGVQYDGSEEVSYPSVTKSNLQNYSLSLYDGTRTILSNVSRLTLQSNYLTKNVGTSEISLTTNSDFVFQNDCAATMVGIDCSDGVFAPKYNQGYTIGFDYTDENGLIGTVVDEIL